MEKKFNIWLALLAALALVLAGCADNGAGSDSDSSVDEPEPNLGTGLTAITADDAEELLQAFGEFYGDYEKSASWKFSGADLQGNGDDGYTFTVTWTGSSAPNVAITLAALNEAAANAATNILEVFLSNPLEWESEPDDGATSAGEITATLRLLDSAAADYYIPESLQNITIALNPGDGGWDNSYYIENKVYYVSGARGLVAWNAAARSDLSTGCVLLKDINMSGQSNWTPIGDNSSPYTGAFDGGGYKVSNIAIGANGDYAGFFGGIGSEGSVEGLGLEIASFTSVVCAGGIAAHNDGEITECWSTGNVTASGSGNTYAGGIAGNNNGTITACYSSGNVTANNDNGRAGGIAGNNYGGTIIACYSTGDVSGAHAGGIAGSTGSRYSITACYSTGTITATGGTSGNYAGGIAGRNIGETNYGITACFWSGDYDARGNSDGTVTNSSKIGDSGTTWETAQEAMNSAIQEYDSSITWSYSGLRLTRRLH